MLLKPTGNLLKALHKAYLHGDPSRLLNPSNLAVPLLLLETSHALVQLFSTLRFSLDLILSTSQIPVSVSFPYCFSFV